MYISEHHLRSVSFTNFVIHVYLFPKKKRELQGPPVLWFQNLTMNLSNRDHVRGLTGRVQESQVDLGGPQFFV